MKHEIYILNETKLLASKFPGNKHAGKKLMLLQSLSRKRKKISCTIFALAK